MENPVVAALAYRHSCALFLSNQDIGRPRLEQIAEAGRLTPSMHGIEPWHFVVVSDETLKTRLASACGPVPSLSSCSAVIVVVCRTADIEPGSEYCQAQMARAGVGAGGLADYARLMATRDARQWALRQCWMAAANMMTAAAAMEVDSCPVWEFDNLAVLDALGLPASRFNVALPIALGYRALMPTPHPRHALAEVATFR